VDALNPIRELEPGARPRDWVNWTQSAPSANDDSSGARGDNRMSDEPELASLTRLNAARHALARSDDGVWAMNPR
jgi:hypothetical protein